jgi:hypothetical protein
MKSKLFAGLYASALVAGLCLTACGGGGGDSAESYVPAESLSFAPTTGTAASDPSQSVPLHWVYVLNNREALSSSFGDKTVNMVVDTFAVKVNPADMKRAMSLQGSVNGSDTATSFSGTYSLDASESVSVESGKTTVHDQSFSMRVSGVQDGEKVFAQVKSTVKGFSPALEWFLDRTDLDQLAVGYTQSFGSDASLDVNVEVSGEPAASSSDKPIRVEHQWTVMEQIASMEVQGKTYTKVVKLALLTTGADMAGKMAPVTQYYWVAKGVGMIRGQGIYRMLNRDDVSVDLVETNLIQSSLL